MDGKALIDVDPRRIANLEAAAQVLSPELYVALKRPFNLEYGQVAICRVMSNEIADSDRLVAMVLSAGTYRGAGIVAPAIVDEARVVTGDFILGTVPETLQKVGLPSAWDMTWQRIVSNETNG